MNERKTNSTQKLLESPRYEQRKLEAAKVQRRLLGAGAAIATGVAITTGVAFNAQPSPEAQKSPEYSLLDSDTVLMENGDTPVDLIEDRVQLMAERLNIDREALGSTVYPAQAAATEFKKLTGGSEGPGDIITVDLLKSNDESNDVSYKIEARIDEGAED